jgi:hypothetical protein
MATHAGVSLKRQNIVEAARWRHRLRGYFWSGRIDDKMALAPRQQGDREQGAQNDAKLSVAATDQ